MTWDEFKSLVDEKLKQEGKSGDIEVGIIDISHPDDHDDIDVMIGIKTFDIF